LFSPQLWTNQGLLTQAGSTTFWDRSTLYGLRGVFAAGATDMGVKYLKDYSSRRLLGDHVPYAVEAWPEGNQRQLSAESALYCRVITEGIFGFRPTGLNSFTITPRIPATWNGMSLTNIIGFNGRKIDISVLRAAGKIKVDILTDGRILMSALIDNGNKLEIQLSKSP
jgi:cellobiose phosphorylase